MENTMIATMPNNGVVRAPEAAFATAVRAEVRNRIAPVGLQGPADTSALRALGYNVPRSGPDLGSPPV